MDKLEIIKEKFRNDKFAQSLGIKLNELTEDTIKMHMELTPEMNNFNGRLHGGAIYALADVAFSIVGNNQNNISVALDCNIYYHESPNPGQILYVIGQRVKQTRKIGTYMLTIYTMENEKENKVATMMSNLYRTGKPHDPNIEIE